MNQIQLAIILLIVGAIIVVIGYHLYQENKFQKTIDKNFNHFGADALNDSSSIVFDNKQQATSSSSRDIVVDIQNPVAIQAEINFDLTAAEDADRVEIQKLKEKFVKYDQIEFPYQNIQNSSCSHIVDIVFDKSVKVKVFPELSQFTGKNIRYFILEKGFWNIYERNKKYIADGFKVVVDLVDNDGAIYSLQLTNIYNELINFSNYHKGYIRQNNSEDKIQYIQSQIKNISQVELELELFMINKVPAPYNVLASFFADKGFVEKNWTFQYIIDGSVAFYIADESGHQFNPNSDYRIFSIHAKLHHSKDPKLVIARIFDFAEDYMQNFESRLLTNNKIVMSDKDYSALDRQVKNYISMCERLKIDLGSELLLKLYP